MFGVFICAWISISWSLCWPFLNDMLPPNPCLFNRQHFTSLSPLLLLFNRMQYFDLHSLTVSPVNQCPRFWLALSLLKILDNIRYDDCASDRTTEKLFWFWAEALFYFLQNIRADSGTNPSSYSMSTGDLKLTTHFHLAPRLRTRKMYIFVPPHAFLTCMG